MASRGSSVYEYEQKCRLLPRWVRKPLASWWDRMSMVLEPEWFRAMVLVWAVWFSMSLAFIMFNVFLPKLAMRNPQLAWCNCTYTYIGSWDIS
ncbi:hypothetical protein P691DRAFT_87703 [Macrolepiota fuliginosa MF-IS2]|uniref:Uncharacterized protein n=1 Tax=Macrolepiota fuliginosa MF-IS2 TaxID=1400762 RepID=A0A9P5WZK4_9AGAR|nr:hypothetical protein P691DRAFT_87703 [Macrolepiota fuliginosa MF-IS2]